MTPHGTLTGWRVYLAVGLAFGGTVAFITWATLTSAARIAGRL